MGKAGSQVAGRWRALLGIEASPVSHRERLVAALGGCVALLAVHAASLVVLGAGAAVLMSLSIGASAVLLFAVPHGPLSQPWALVGGHLASALIGVACARLLPSPLLAGALAVGLAIAAMHYLRCLHPPGGATALAAVAGGEEIRALGFGFVAAPVLLNVAVILAVAVAFNACFAWRRYPAHLARAAGTAPPAADAYGPISHEDFVYALAQMDSFVDVSEDDLLRIYALATNRAPRTATPPSARQAPAAPLTATPRSPSR